MKKKVVRQKLTQAQKAMQAEIATKKKAFEEKQAALSKEAEELDALQRSAIRENVNTFSFSKNEIECFVAAFEGFAQKQDLVRALLAASRSDAEINQEHFETKLIRMGIA